MSIILVLDCGATNLRAIALDQYGNILASHHIANCTSVDSGNPDYHIWDFDEIWKKLEQCVLHTLAQLEQLEMPLTEVIGITVTTFGVDGTAFDRFGKQIYPIISWKCPRTISIMQNLDRYFDINDLYQRNGVGLHSFNTLFKLIWLKENQPDIFKRMDKFVFISSMLNHRLTGVFSTDHTMAGTSMMTDLRRGSWDHKILSALDLTENHFPSFVYAGDQIGHLSAILAKKWGLNQVPVISSGHDTQFAVFGSGAKLHQPVLSSGTWEILMVRTEKAFPNFHDFSQGLTTEFDAIFGYFNPAVQWLGSGVMEWIGKLFFSDVKDSQDYYSTMISAAENIPVGSNGVSFSNSFLPSNGVGAGKIKGLSITSTRGEIYRAALEYMAMQLSNGLNLLQHQGGFQTDSLICVGGGSKNKLWNQIRADVLGFPIDIVDVAECTVLGAAMFAFTHVGVYENIAVAQQVMSPVKRRIYPSEQSSLYQQLRQNY